MEQVLLQKDFTALFHHTKDQLHFSDLELCLITSALVLFLPTSASV